MHWLFDEVLALLPGQENSGAFSQSVDECHLLSTIPQLQGFHSEDQTVYESKMAVNMEDLRMCALTCANTAHKMLY